MENEGNAMRTLNNLKNRRIAKCDYAFASMVQEDQNHDEDFVSEVRQTFFNFLKPFLKSLPDHFLKQNSMV
jgi:hypothetical protein